MNTIAARDARIEKLENELATIRAEGMTRADVAKQQEALRIALAVVEAANGLWVTDKPEFWTGEDIVIDGTTYRAASGFTLRANEGTYHRQDFSAAIAKVKEVLGE